MIICLGKQLNDDGSLDYIGRGRCDVAYRLLQGTEDEKLILTGARSYHDDRTLRSSEAQAMLSYLKTSYKNVAESRIIIEDEGKSTFLQLIRIKTEILIPQSIKNVTLVTDDIHMRRAHLILSCVLGDEYQIRSESFHVDIAGKYRALIEEWEAKVYGLIMKNMVAQFEKGDHEAFKKYELELQEKQKQAIKSTGKASTIVDLKGNKVVDK